MRFRSLVLIAAAFLLAGALSWVSAVLAAGVIESRSGDMVAEALTESGHDWAEVSTDGLQVQLSGTAPTEADRFNALTVASRMIDASRVIDGMSVAASAPIEAPRFSIEILRNDEGVSMIGLVPASLDREALSQEVASLAGGAEVVDLLETADHPVPDGWLLASSFGLDALERLPRSKISISANRVSATAISSSGAEKRRLENELNRLAPEGVEVVLDISAPRPVITPFTLRFLIDQRGGARFDACSADTEEARARILEAAARAGLEGEVQCTLGLGVPTPEWADAVVQGIEAVANIGGGSVTFSDADVTFVGTETTSQSMFDRSVGELENNLPNVFSVEPVLPRPEIKTEDDGPVEFTATRQRDGAVDLAGRLPNEVVRTTVESFAHARFGMDEVVLAARLDDTLPEEWPIRVLAGLQALDELADGSLVVRPETVQLTGNTGNPDARAEITRLLAEKLGEGQSFEIDVTYREALDPLAALPTPQECLARVQAAQELEKIAFEPGSTDVSGTSVRVLDQIAETLRACSKVEIQIEIAGHTDSQGRETMNLDLSQARADSVREALISRRVMTSMLTSTGYGETQPIADNDTAEGREANRRIEFRMAGEASGEEADGDAEADDGPADDDADAETDSESESGDAAEETGETE
ncbi:OmpA family protein [Tropicimonas sp. IMCC34011]|uniref:OmpA family protein n=1 Tax=Tropicimonas sp. IMCC34011 TaxID=2248759 RepID=UPI000E23FA67|nr:OmpA family protein [Tropicimonas sp. IMCC34011]